MPTDPSVPRAPRPWKNRTVLAFGLASLFSDAGHETATAILPFFLVSLGGSAAALGLVEGVADALSTAAKLTAGWFSDGLTRRKPLGIVGYVATGIGMGAFALAKSPAHVLAIRSASWVGRGMRGPVRDAMLTDAVNEEARGPAFGFHRAMDTIGAVLGPLLALLLLARCGYRAIFALTLVPGLLSVLAFASAPEAPHPRVRRAFGATLRELPRSYRRFLVAVGIFGLGDFARGLLVLRAAQMLPAQGIPPTTVGVALYVVHNLVHACSAYGIGVLGVRVGALRVLAGGYFLFALMAVGFLLAPATLPIWLLALLFSLAGLATATEEVLEPTVAAAMLPEPVRGTGFGALAAVNGVGDLVASVVVGWLWTAVFPAAGFLWAAVLGVAGGVAVTRVQ